MKRIKKLIGWVDPYRPEYDNEIKVLVQLDDDTMQFITMYHPPTDDYLIARTTHDDYCEDWDWDNRYDSSIVEYCYGFNPDGADVQKFKVQYQEGCSNYLPTIELDELNLHALEVETYPCIQDNPGYTVEKISDNKYKIIFE